MQKKQILYIALGLFLMLFLLFGGKAAKAIIQPLIAPAPAERHSKAKARNITLQANDYVLFGSYQGEPILGRCCVSRRASLCFGAAGFSALRPLMQPGRMQPFTGARTLPPRDQIVGRIVLCGNGSTVWSRRCPGRTARLPHRMCWTG